MYNLKKFIQGPSLDDEIQSYSTLTTTRVGRPQETSNSGTEVREIYEQIIQEPSSASAASSSSANNSKIKHRNRKSIPTSKSKSISEIMKMCEADDLADELESYIGFDHSILDVRDQWDWTPLMTASASGSVNVLRILLSNGANWKLRNKTGNTALDIARNHKQFEVCNILEEWERLHQVKHEQQEDDDDCVILEDDDDCMILEPIDFQVPKFCDICKTNYCNDQRKHDNSIAHLVSSGPGNLDDKIHYGIPESNRGFQLMLRSGWSRKGLGPDADGHKFPVKTVLKRDRKGLGDKSNLKAKITHFGPFDTDAVQGIRPRVERINTVRKKEHQHNMNRERRKEIHLRRQLNGL